eukprot:28234-Amphidinium_carterae.1
MASTGLSLGACHFPARITHDGWGQLGAPSLSEHGYGQGCSVNPGARCHKGNHCSQGWHTMAIPSVTEEHGVVLITRLRQAPQFHKNPPMDQPPEIRCREPPGRSTEQRKLW